MAETTSDQAASGPLAAESKTFSSSVDDGISEITLKID